MNYVYNVVKDEGDSFKSDFVQKAYHYEYDNITDNEYPLEGKKHQGIDRKHWYLWVFPYDYKKSR